MIARFEKIAIANNINSMSKFFDQNGLTNCQPKALNVEFGHFDRRYLLRNYFLMAWALMSQKSKTNVIRHVYKKRPRFTMNLITTLTNWAAGWFVFDRIIFNVLARIEDIRTQKMKRSVRPEIKFFHNFKLRDTKMFSTIKTWDLPYRATLPFNIQFNFTNGIQPRILASSHQVESSIRLFRFPISLFKKRKVRFNDDNYSYRIFYNKVW